MDERDRLLTPEEVSAFVGVPVTTLAQWRYRKCGIPYLRIGRLVRYSQADVESFLQGSKVAVRGQLTKKRGEHVRLS